MAPVRIDQLVMLPDNNGFSIPDAVLNIFPWKYYCWLKHYLSGNNSDDFK